MRDSSRRTMKYKKKIDGEVSQLRLLRYGNDQKIRFKSSISRQVEIERMVKQLLASHGIGSIYSNYYILFAKKLNELKTKHAGSVLGEEYEILRGRWVERGLDSSILATIKGFIVSPVKPITEMYAVGQSSDDCERRLNPSMFSIASPYFPCGDDTVGSFDYRSGARFTGINITQGSTILSAYLRLKAWGYLGSLVNAIVKGENSDNALTFSDAANFDARTRTTASVNWAPAAWVTGTWYDSPNIASIIQEIVNRIGWTKGNAIVIFWEDQTGWDVQDLTYAYSFDHGALEAPQLIITWMG